MSVGRKKAIKYVKRMLPLFRAVVVKFCSINRLYIYIYICSKVGIILYSIKSSLEKAGITVIVCNFAFMWLHHFRTLELCLTVLGHEEMNSEELHLYKSVFNSFSICGGILSIADAVLDLLSIIHSYNFA